MTKRTVEAQPTIDLLDERACAFQQSIVFMRQAYPNMALMTYDNEVHQNVQHLILSKIVTGILDANGVQEWLLFTNCEESTTADNIVGGLKSVAQTVSGHTVTTEIYPLMKGRETCSWEGGALVKVSCATAAGICLKFGCGDFSNMHTSPNIHMSGEKINCENGRAVLEGNTAVITHQKRPIITAVTGSGDMRIAQLEGCEDGFGTYVLAQTQANGAYLLFGFSKEKARAVEIASGDPNEELQTIQDYYAHALERWSIDTPNPELNEAFIHARLNLEYAWFRPLGWTESIHHWPTFWHMEQTAAEEWAGYFDRTRECLRTQMTHLLESGAVPDMCPDGSTRRDWGGNNQFFFRELNHYVKMTGDLDFLKVAEPYLYRILDQTFAEYDPTGKGVLCWNTQIGNQEDMESTPGAGAAPGSEGVRMLELMSDFMRWLGHNERSDEYKTKGELCRTAWQDKLLLRDVGRPIWYEDIIGEKRLDTTYHGLAYPIIYNQVDDFYKVSFADHMLHRLSGREGEIFQSNHFGDHAYDSIPTWGMQAGSDMQPFATAAYAKLGLREDAVRPLAFIAKRVCDEYQRGSWPETANEKRFAYFSPSAGVFAQEVIESIFGIEQNLVDNVTKIVPCFPSDWEHASLTVRGADMQYEKKGAEHCFTINISNSTDKIFQWKLPPYSDIRCKVNGKDASVHTYKGCGWFEATVTLTNAEQHTVIVSYDAIDIQLEYQKSIACGDRMQMAVRGAELIGVSDRCGIFGDMRFSAQQLDANVKPELLDPYKKFGWFGIVNFARRVFSVTLSANGVTFDVLCTLTVVPPVCVNATEKQGRCKLELVNNTVHTFGDALLHVADKKQALDLMIKPNSTCTAEFVCENAAALTPGKNHAVIWLTDTQTGKKQPFTFDLECESVSVHPQLIPLDETKLQDPVNWRDNCYHENHGFIMQMPDNFMKGMFETLPEITFPGLDFSFALNKKGYIPLSMDGHRITEVPLTGIKAKKLYILFSAFAHNHDMFSTLFHVELEAEKGDAFIRPIYRKELTLPGQLDMGYGNEVIYGFSSYTNATERGILPVFPQGADDYPNTYGPLYPERSLWCVNRAVEVCNTVLNLIEIELTAPQQLIALRMICTQADAAGGIYALAYL